MKETTKNIVIPVFIGIVLFGIEMLITPKINWIKSVFVFSIVYIIAAYCLVKRYRRYDVCGWFQIGSCGSNILFIALILLFMPKTALSFKATFVLLVNWLAITSVCIILKFLVRENKYSDFKRFFRLSSIIFGVFYVGIMLYALFLKGINLRAGVNDFNLVPFSTIKAYIIGEDKHLGGATINIIANIFLFIPLGFYAGVVLRKSKMKIKIIIITLIPIIVELIQWVYSLGVFDVDDIILNVFGGLLGILALRGVEKLYCIVKKSDTVRLFLI